MSRFCSHRRRHAWQCPVGFPAAAALAMLLALSLATGCGGGGGDEGPDGEGPVPTPGPGPTQGPAPTGGPGPTPTPAPRAGEPRVLIVAGSEVDGLVVDTVREARLAPNGEIYAIAAIADEQRSRAFLRGDAAGRFVSVADRDDVGILGDFGTLSDLRVQAADFVLMEAGGGLDLERLLLFDGTNLRIIAGPGSNLVAPDFRLLGNFAAGAGMRLGFVAGAEPCEVVEATGVNRCRLRLFIEDQSERIEVEVAGEALMNLAPRIPEVAVADSGAVYFSIPGEREEPTFVRYEAGETEILLTGLSQIEDVGRLLRPEIEAINSAEQILLTSTRAEDDRPRPTLLGIYDDGDFTIVATEGPLPDQEEGAEDFRTVSDLDIIGLDESGRALFVETTSIGEPAREIRALSLADGATRIDVAVEREFLGGPDLAVLEIIDPHLNASGQVAFVARLGVIEEVAPGATTVRVRDTQILLWRGPGDVETILTTGGTAQTGLLGGLAIADFDADGNLLLFANRVEFGGRAVLYAPNSR